MKISWGALFFVILVACSPSTVAANIVPTNTPAAPPIQTAKIIPSPTTLPRTAITPTIKTIAPVSREVELSDLELNNSTRLILYYEPSDSLRIMARQDVRPQRIPNINPQSIINYGIEISPNHKWFAYNVFKEKRDEVAYYDIWISSIDGKQQKLAVSDVRGATGIRWATNEQLELWYYPYPRQCPERNLVINPFTQEILNPPAIPRLTEPDCFVELITNTDHSKMLYRNPANSLWNIYDFNTAKSQPIFPWLSQKESFNLWSRYIRWLPSGITLIFPNQNSINTVIDLPPSALADTNRQWTEILLPDSNSILWNVPSWVSLEAGLIGLDVVDYEVDPLSADENTPISKFVVLDLHNSALYDYDFDRARTEGIQRVSDTFVDASADNRFLAWTIYKPPGMGYAIETVVLERATGKIARIKGFQFLGWGEVNQ